MAEVLSNVAKGPVHAGPGDVIRMIASGAVALWDPVILTAAGTGETYPRVGTTTAAGNRLFFGIVVDLLNKDTIAAGDVVLVQKRNIAKVRVVSTAVVLGDPLETSATAGKAQEQTAIAHAGTYTAADADAMEKKSVACFGQALSAATVDGDIILVDLDAKGRAI